MPVKGGREIVLIRPIGTDTPHRVRERSVCISSAVLVLIDEILSSFCCFETRDTKPEQGDKY